ncbi:MAG: 50S ribosomal protein L4 [Acidobacteriota bacterium]|nr:50S ribosomal protein L4 [Acidobacteriota bacterium]
MSLTVDRRSVSGETVGSIHLDEAVFGITPNVPVLHQVVTAQLAAARSGTQSTKTRAEVSGGGKKPFKQKGTGRARQGSERAPHFTGGGIALGPKPRSYRQKTPRKMVQLALRSALSDRASEGRIMVVDEWSWAEPSTKAAKSALAALGLSGRILVVLGRDQEEAYKSFRNLDEVQLILQGELNAYDVLCNDWIVFTAATLPGGSGESTTDTDTVTESATDTDTVTASATDTDTVTESATDSDTAAAAAASEAPVGDSEEPAAASDDGGPGGADAPELDESDEEAAE